VAKGKTGASVTERDRRTTRKETVLRDRLADAEKLVAKRAGQLLAATAERDEAAVRLAEVAGYTVEGYCLRERTRVTIRDATPIVLANGHRALAGSCPACGARVVRMTRGRAVPAST
jgi:predicted RNA-binding Zn-ribbon protein involved in translation (DUF1610 family)